MFESITDEMRARMAFLDEIDRRDRRDSTPRLQRLRQVSEETGQFLALAAAGCPAGEMIEIGTSAGYSALWISLACRERGQKLTTYEILPEKAALARETFAVAGVEDVVELVEGDARSFLERLEAIAFCFLDAEKDVYGRCYETVVPRLVPGGLLLADNVISHQVELQPMIDAALVDPRVDALVVPIGKGELVCRKR